MAYEKLNLTDGTVFTAAHVAHLETGIDSAMSYRRQLTSDDDCNSLEDGAYWYSTASPPANAPFANAAVMFVFGGGNRQIQLGFRYGQAGSGRFRAKQDGSWKLWAEFAGLLGTEDYPGCYCRFNGDVQEWVNPPMVPGVEYRTTERHNGNVVYAKCVDFGALPVSTRKYVTFSTALATVIRMTGTATNSGGTVQFFPFHNTAGEIKAKVNATKQIIEMYTYSDLSTYNGMFYIFYTKD